MKVAGPRRLSELAEACLQSPHQRWQDSTVVKIESKEEAKISSHRIQQPDGSDAWRSCWIPCSPDQ
jgi:hypothetical protein